MKTKEAVCKRIILNIFFLLVLCRTAGAQDSQKATLTAADAGTCSATSTACLVINIPSGSGGATFNIGANASANTVQFEASADYGATWVALSVTPSSSTTTVTSTTGTGAWQANVAGYTKARMRCSTFVGGTTDTYINLSTASARSGGGGSGTGTLTASGLSLPVNQIMLGNVYPNTKPLGSLGTTTTVLHGNAAGAPTFGAVALASDVSGQLPIAAVGSAGLSGTSPATISSTGAIGCATCVTSAAALTNNAVVIGGGLQATKVSTGFTTDGTAELDLGVSAGTAGTLGMLGATAEAFNMTGRVGVGFPVPYFTPRATPSAIAFDLFPHGAPSDVSATTGVAWYDLCSTDIAADGTNYECIRLGKFSSGMSQLSSTKGGTGTVRALGLQMNGAPVGIGLTTAAAITSLLTLSNAAGGGTSIPAIELQDNGVSKFYFAHSENIGNFFTDAAAGDEAIRGAGGAIRIGSNSSTPAASLTIAGGNPGTVTEAGANSAKSYLTATNCSSSASPAVCGSAAAGSVAVPTGVTPTLVVNTTAVTANSQILFTPDESLGTKLGVTCNSTIAQVAIEPIVTARTAATSFTIQYNTTITVNPICLSYWIIN